GRHHVGQRRAPASEEPAEVQQVIRVATHAARRETPGRQMGEVAVRQLTERAAAVEAVTVVDVHHPHVHGLLLGVEYPDSAGNQSRTVKPPGGDRLPKAGKPISGSTRKRARASAPGWR